MRKAHFALIFLAAILLFGCQTAGSMEKTDSGAMASDMKDAGMAKEPMESKMMPDSKDTMNTEMKGDMKDTGMTKEPTESKMLPESKDTMNTEMK